MMLWAVGWGEGGVVGWLDEGFIEDGCTILYW